MRISDKLFRLGITAELAVICGGYMAVKLLPAAYQWRGYWAVGGEWLLIIFAAVVGGWLGGGLADRVIIAEKRMARR